MRQQYASPLLKKSQNRPPRKNRNRLAETLLRSEVTSFSNASDEDNINENDDQNVAIDSLFSNLFSLFGQTESSQNCDVDSSHLTMPVDMAAEFHNGSDNASNVGTHRILPIETETPHATSAAYWKAAKKAFHYIRNPQKAKIWTTRYETKCTHIKSIIRRRIKKKKPIIILSGTHGSINGQRTANSAERHFYEEDYRTYKANEQGDSQYVEVKDITRLDNSEIRKILTGKTPVIAAFCFSRNDSQIRDYLNWPAERNCINAAIAKKV